MSGCCFLRTPTMKARRWTDAVFLLICFLLCYQSAASEVRWRKEVPAEIDGQRVDCAFSGGMQFSKPAFVDIDADGDLDVCVGDKDGKIRLFQNEGTAQDPRWKLFADLHDSTIGERSFPTFADIDADGDCDLFVGNREGRICFFRNDGSADSPLWTRVSDYYDSVDVGSESAPILVDIDADSDLDLFVGKENGTLSFYRNLGTEDAPEWDLVSENYGSIDVGACSTPAFVDLDADGDFDLLMGEENGNINFYRNIGNRTSPDWELISDNYSSIRAGKRSSPAFGDIDGDSDLDLLIGQDEGRVLFFKNEGTVYLPWWAPVTENYLFIDFGTHCTPALVDIDGDGDMDLFSGEYEGNINFYRNDKAFPVPCWSKITESYFAIEADDHSSPAFADIDGDGDKDLFVGRKDGKLDFYENIGTTESALWKLIPHQYDFIDVGGYASPAFADMDDDEDLDLLVGQTHGKVYFYRNDGTPQLASWTTVSDDFESIDVGWYGAPTFGDMDQDGDPDFLVGNDEGRIYFYRNDGTSEDFAFVLVSDFCDSIDVGERGTPALCDFDSDGDPDLFIGESNGGLHYYRNLTLNSIRGIVSDGAEPWEDAVVYLSGSKQDSTFTDSSGSYGFVGLPVGDYCVFRDPASIRYCFSPLDSDTFEINFQGVTRVEESGQTGSSEHLQLFPNYPNPFNPLTNIVYYLPADAHAKLTIYNLIGARVRELADGFQTSGWKKATWDGKDSESMKVASGVYFCKLQTAEGSEIIRMVLLK
jgi:hypothetical protein